MTKQLNKMKTYQLLVLILTTFFLSCTENYVKGINLGSDLDAKETEKSSIFRSSSGDVVGKLTAGYQGWFICEGDGSPKNQWVHWSNGSLPSPGNQTFELWPDMREYSKGYQTGYANLGNGEQAKLFSSFDVIHTHMQWAQQYGIDCIALQRFGCELGDPVMKQQRDSIAVKVKNACQTFGRKFYIMYDISGWNNFQTEIKSDWSNTIVNSLNLIGSNAYAIQNGKPVVCIWGIAVPERPGNVTSWKDVIDWFKNQGCYVIVGTNDPWRSDNVNLPAITAGNMISPWTVGRFSNDNGVDNYASVMEADKNYCDQHGIDYQPVVFPGFAWSNWNGGAQNQIPRRHGDFMWRQFAQVRNKGIPSVYVAMFDEYDEGTAIAKAAENASMKPTNQYFLTLDADGVNVSSDFYLRLTRDGARLIKNEIPFTWAHPTPHIISNNYSTFITQNVPATMIAGESYNVSLTFKNSGLTTWSRVGEYKLGSQNPQDNMIWGTNRIYLLESEYITSGGQKTFSFNVTAPSTAGSYNFQWRMVQDGVEWFGDFSSNISIQVYSTFLDHCDVLDGWNSHNPISVNTIDKKEGTGCIESSGNGTDEFKKVFSPFNAHVTEDDGILRFWYYVSDITKLNGENQIELGSGGGPDTKEYNWPIDTLTNGWNLISKKFSDADVTNGTPDLNALNWFRIYHYKSGTVTTRVDGIQIIKE